MLQTIKKVSFILFATVFYFCALTDQANASCDKVGGVITYNGAAANPVNDDGVAGDQCSDVPSAYKIKFFKIGLCESDPGAGAALGGTPDFSSCAFIYDGVGLDHEIEVPGRKSFPTGSGISIPTGEYGYLVALFSNKLGLKNTVTFDAAVTGKGGASGTTCWTSSGITSFMNEVIVTPHGTTLGATIKTITCGNAGTENPVYNYEIFTHFGGAADACTDFDTDGEFANGSDSSASIGGGGDTFSVRLIQNDGTYADRCTNSEQMLWVINSTKYKVTPTSTYSLEFKLTDSVSIDFDNTTGNIMKMGNDPIQAIFSISN
jgi:hypothetical protein